MTRVGADEDGFTLVELIIALALFGLIAIAGLGLVEGVLGIRSRTDGRLERLAEIQRAMFLIDADLEQISPGRLAEDRGTVSFRRHAASLDGRGQAIDYALAGRTLDRIVGGGAVPLPRVQHLLTGVTSARWSYYASGAWREGWPPDPKQSAEWPAAVALDLKLTDRGTLRRVVELPERP